MNMTFATLDREGREIINAQEFIEGKLQEPTEPGITGPWFWLADNQSRDLNNEL